MTGMPKHNFPAFDRMTKYLRDRGWDAINPADLDRSLGINEDSSVEATKEKMELMVNTDYDLLKTCGSIVMLKGWERSTGARAEHAQAVQRGFHIYYEESI